MKLRGICFIGWLVSKSRVLCARTVSRDLKGCSQQIRRENKLFENSSEIIVETSEILNPKLATVKSALLTKFGDQKKSKILTGIQPIPFAMYCKVSTSFSFLFT